tara:strand:- start:825 stop:1055 length:231 start_codon:yes stop_codon:yes gene_type:complete
MPLLYTPAVAPTPPTPAAAPTDASMSSNYTGEVKREVEQLRAEVSNALRFINGKIEGLEREQAQIRSLVEKIAKRG